jgi:peptidoglycan/LPS O-acetylase OafA/YrhL
LALRRLGTAAMVAGATVLVVGSYLLATTVEAFSPLLNLTPQFLLLFALGVAGARVATSGVLSAERAAVAVAGVATAALVALLVVNDLPWVEEHYFWVDLVAGVAAAAGLGAMASGHLAPLSRVFASRGPAAVGAFSYSIYCVHLPILWLVWHFGIAPLEPSAVVGLALLAFVGLPVVLAGSYVFSRAFERPFVMHRSFGQLRSHYFRRERPQTAGGLSADPSPATFTRQRTESHSVTVEAK